MSQRRGKSISSTAAGRAAGGKGARASSPPSRESGSLSRGGARRDVVAMALAATVAVLVYVNAFQGAFVYDDVKQIAGNSLIQDASRFGQAMTSDVWAFKGEKGTNWSNYWRPVFILWLMANYRLFGLESTVGWHLTNALLHALVVILAFRLLRRLGMDRAVAFAIVLLFAVHPVHVESVAWISGSGDLVLAAALLGSLYLLITARESSSTLALGASYALYAAALLSKEISVLFPLIVLVAVFATSDASQNFKARALGAIRTVLPYGALTLAYVVLHLLLLGQAQIRTPWQVGPAAQLLTLPSLIAFYLRQCLLPIWIGPSYPIRVVTPQTIGLTNFFIPAVIVAAALWFLVRLARGRPVRQIGLALFFVPLAPAMNVNAFTPEQLVHDRYLYLPLLGLLMVLVPAAADAVQMMLASQRATRGPGDRSTSAAQSRVEAAARSRQEAAAKMQFGRGRPPARTGPHPGAESPDPRAARVTLWGAAVWCLPLAAITLWYNSAWTSELALWRWAVGSDPTSATNLSEYAGALVKSGRPQEAKPALDQALAIYPLTSAYLMRADLAISEKRYPEAEADLKLVLSSLPDNGPAYERLAICYEQQGRLTEAEALLRTARDKVPHRRGAFTDSLAVVLYLQNKRAEALAELESVRAQAPRELGSSAQSVLFHLGSLYAELGRTAEARAALQEYLDLTAHIVDAPTTQMRAQARAALAKLP